MKSIYTYAIIALLGTALVIPSPLIAFAKENGNGNGKGKSEKVEKNKKKDDDKKEYEKKVKKNEVSWVGCATKSFGHLIAPGWIKKNGNIEISGDCSRDDLPRGIAWLYGYHSTSTTPVSTTTTDTVSPIITNLRIRAISTTSAIVSWETNERSDSRVWYSTNSPVNISTATSSNKTDLTRNHNIHLKNLVPNTNYYLIVSSKDKAQNNSTSSQISWKTLEIATTTPIAPVISNIVATVGTSTAKIIWNTDISSNSTVFYGTTNPLDTNSSTTASTTNSTLVKNHEINISNLATSTTYYIKVQSISSDTGTKTSDQFSITTSN